MTFSPVHVFIHCFLGSLFLAAGSVSGAAPSLPQVLPISSTGGYRQVTRSVVRVPKGVTQLVTEQRQGTGWKPVKVQHLTFGPRETSKAVPIALPRGVALSQIRMVGYKGAKFPAGFTSRQHDFSRNDDQTQTGGILRLATTNNLMAANAVAQDAAVAPTAAAAAPAPAVESDIWKIVGNRLFFFNQYRGLQVFDMTHPETPVRTGSVRMAASGEQMYVLDEAGSVVALLGRSSDREHHGRAALYVVKVTNGIPAVIQEVALAGQISDSRLIGDKLYLLSHPNANYGAIYGATQATLQTVDLADPASPVVLPDLMLDTGWSSQLQAAGRYLLVSTSGYSTAGMMNLIDTQTLDGTPVFIKSFPLKGQIQDKFKMSIVNGAAVAVTLSWGGPNWQRETWVETFPLEGPETAPLAQVELIGARNENLHATRFDGDRLYAVTFRNVDPLFVVDLADPAQPSVRGVLEIPGWSTYLEPLGDRLLAVGVESGHVTVSLFDVANMEAPTLLSRIALGTPGSSSWSEATYDEKAIEYFPEAGLVLVPFQTWGATGYVNAMQAIEVGPDSLTSGITIPHGDKARRGAVIGGHLVSISGQEMQVLNRSIASAEPEAELSLSWRVDRVVHFGNYLLQLADGAGASYDGSDKKAAIRVTASSDPDTLLEEIELGVGRIVSTAQKGQRLFVAQWVPAEGDKRPAIRTWVLDLSTPPQVDQVTSTSHVINDANEYDFNLDNVQGLWVGDSKLVWHVPGHEARFFYGCFTPIQIQPILQPIGIITIGTPGLIIANPIINLRAGNLATGTVIPNQVAAPARSTSAPLVRDAAVKVTAKTTAQVYPAMLLCPILNANSLPVASPVIRIGTDKEIRGASQAFAENGFLFASYDEATVGKSLNTLNRLSIWGGSVYNPSQIRTWLQVVDFNASTPVVRDPVSIPGPLLSISQADAQGAILLTNHDKNSGSTRVIQASAYDGLTAYQVDSEELNLSPWLPSTSDGTHLYFVRDGSSPAVIGWGYDGGTGSLKELGTWTTTVQTTTLGVVENFLFASGYGLLETATIGANGALTPAAAFDTPYDLVLRVDRTVLNDAGLWIPANDYGVEFLPWQQLQP